MADSFASRVDGGSKPLATFMAQQIVARMGPFKPKKLICGLACR